MKAELFTPVIYRGEVDPENLRTFVVFGTEEGVTRAHNGRVLRRAMNNCTHVLIHDAAHDVQAERPEAFADVAGDFLARGRSFLLPVESTLINPGPPVT